MVHRKCLTPGAKYHLWLREESLEIFVDFPKSIAMSFTEDETKVLEEECHNAVEAILARYWKRSRGVKR